MQVTSYRDVFELKNPDRFYIGGEWLTPQGDRHLEVVFPATERVVARVPEASIADVDRAVAAARKAFDQGPWPRMSPGERANKLIELAEVFRKHAVGFAGSFTLEVGYIKPDAEALGMAGYGALMMAANIAKSIEFAEVRPRSYGMGVGVVVHEPVGVVAAILPWNCPMGLTMQKVASALAAGCTVVLKPAPETPLYTWQIAQCFEEAGMPPGVLNIVPAGREVGDHLVRHRGIDKVSFTGSTAAGKHIAAVCAERVARVGLELGGKSAAVILDDADPAAVAVSIVPHFTRVCGQMCAALTRLVVPRKRQNEYAEALSAEMRKLKPGNPFDAQTTLAPLAMKRQHDRVMSYIEKGKAEGGRIVTGGRRPPELDTGYFVEPTLFTNVDRKATIAREEIFGPVAALLTYDTVEEAIAIANDSDFGLNAAVYTNDGERAYQIARRILSGNVTHNGWVVDNAFPFGGFKQSGIGRENGPEGLKDYCELKTIYMDARPKNLDITSL
ncbi:MAG: aldehyde dehydrogenase [Steroidobacteraceae bacterium]